jgi:hypothetical protein
MWTMLTTDKQIAGKSGLFHKWAGMTVTTYQLFGQSAMPQFAKSCERLSWEYECIDKFTRHRGRFQDEDLPA